MTWEEGEKYCQDNYGTDTWRDQGNICSIQCESDEYKLKDKMEEKGMTEVWIGMRGGKWSDGQGKVTGPYQRGIWAPGEPSGPAGQDCVYYELNKQMQTTDCTEKKQFVCKNYKDCTTSSITRSSGQWGDYSSSTFTFSFSPSLVAHVMSWTTVFKLNHGDECSLTWSVSQETTVNCAVYEWNSDDLPTTTVRHQRGSPSVTYSLGKSIKSKDADGDSWSDVCPDLSEVAILINPQTALSVSASKYNLILDPAVTTPVGTYTYEIQKGTDTAYPSEQKTLIVEVWDPCEPPTSVTASSFTQFSYEWREQTFGFDGTNGKYLLDGATKQFTFGAFTSTVECSFQYEIVIPDAIKTAVSSEEKTITVTSNDATIQGQHEIVVKIKTPDGTAIPDVELKLDLELVDPCDFATFTASSFTEFSYFWREQQFGFDGDKGKYLLDGESKEFSFGAFISSPVCAFSYEIVIPDSIITAVSSQDRKITVSSQDANLKGQQQIPIKIKRPDGSVIPNTELTLDLELVDPCDFATFTSSSFQQFSYFWKELQFGFDGEKGKYLLDGATKEFNYGLFTSSPACEFSYEISIPDQIKTAVTTQDQRITVSSSDHNLSGQQSILVKIKRPDGSVIPNTGLTLDLELLDPCYYATLNISDVFQNPPSNTITYMLGSPSAEMVWTDTDASSDINGCGAFEWSILEDGAPLSPRIWTFQGKSLSVFSTDSSDAGKKSLVVHAKFVNYPQVKVQKEFMVMVVGGCGQMEIELGKKVFRDGNPILLEYELGKPIAILNWDPVNEVTRSLGLNCGRIVWEVTFQEPDLFTYVEPHTIKVHSTDVKKAGLHQLSAKISFSEHSYIQATKLFRIKVVDPCKYSELTIDQDDFPEANYTLGHSPSRFNWTDDSVQTNSSIDCGPYVWAVYKQGRPLTGDSKPFSVSQDPHKALLKSPISVHASDVSEVHTHRLAVEVRLRDYMYSESALTEFKINILDPECSNENILKIEVGEQQPDVMYEVGSPLLTLYLRDLFKVNVKQCRQLHLTAEITPLKFRQLHPIQVSQQTFILEIYASNLRDIGVYHIRLQAHANMNRYIKSTWISFKVTIYPGQFSFGREKVRGGKKRNFILKEQVKIMGQKWSYKFPESMYAQIRAVKIEPWRSSTFIIYKPFGLTIAENSKTEVPGKSIISVTLTNNTSYKLGLDIKKDYLSPCRNCLNLKFKPKIEINNIGEMQLFMPESFKPEKNSSEMFHFALTKNYFFEKVFKRKSLKWKLNRFDSETHSYRFTFDFDKNISMGILDDFIKARICGSFGCVSTIKRIPRQLMPEEIFALKVLVWIITVLAVLVTIQFVLNQVRPPQIKSNFSPLHHYEKTIICIHIIGGRPSAFAEQFNQDLMQIFTYNLYPRKDLYKSRSLLENLGSLNIYLWLLVLIVIFSQVKLSKSPVYLNLKKIFTPHKLIAFYEQYLIVFLTSAMFYLGNKSYSFLELQLAVLFLTATLALCLTPIILGMAKGWYCLDMYRDLAQYVVKHNWLMGRPRSDPKMLLELKQLQQKHDQALNRFTELDQVFGKTQLLVKEKGFAKPVFQLLCCWLRPVCLAISLAYLKPCYQVIAILLSESFQTTMLVTLRVVDARRRLVLESLVVIFTGYVLMLLLLTTSYKTRYIISGVYVGSLTLFIVASSIAVLVNAVKRGNSRPAAEQENHMDQEMTTQQNLLNNYDQSEVEKLQKLGYRVVFNEGGGNCVFLALAHLIWGSDSYHLYMRKQVAGWVKAHPQHYKQRKEMAMEGIPASKVELQAAADIFFAVIQIYEDVNEPPTIIYSRNTHQYCNTLALWRISPDHVVALQKSQFPLPLMLCPYSRSNLVSDGRLIEQKSQLREVRSNTEEELKMLTQIVRRRAQNTSAPSSQQKTSKMEDDGKLPEMSQQQLGQNSPQNQKSLSNMEQAPSMTYHKGHLVPRMPYHKEEQLVVVELQN